jgi:hypothetical protein
MTIRDRLKDQLGELAMQVHELAAALDQERAARRQVEAERDALKAAAAPPMGTAHA